MTVITKLKLSGFKSFPKATEIPFEKDFSIIIGPNGSGKSNIIDAFCFVLGKSGSKSLRAEKSSNLIFNGGKKGSAAKEAEVAIFFNNDKKDFPLEDKTIKISRVLKKTGNSIYKINDQTRTRQQIIDLLNAAKIDPEGYNIILQGDIIKFTEMRSDDRRKLIEEIAGISVFEDKKEKALSELEKVSGKLNEAEIILTEREVNLRELKKERDDAKRHNEIQEQIKNNKATILDHKLKEREAKKAIIEKEISEFDKKIESQNQEIDQLKKFTDDAKKRIYEINKEVEEKGEKDQIILRKKVEGLREDIIKHESRIDVLKTELKKITERKYQLKINVSDLNKQIQESKSTKKDLLENEKDLAQKEKIKISEIDTFKHKYGLYEFGEYQNKIQVLEKDIEKFITEKEKIVLEEQDTLREKIKVELLLEEVNKKLVVIDSMKQEDKQNLKKLNLLRAEFKSITEGLTKRLSEDSVFASQLNSSRRNLVEKNEKLALLRAKNMGIKDHVSQDIAIKKIITSGDSGVYGTLSSLGSIASKFALSLEVAAGSRMKSVIVSNDVIAEKFIKKLKEEKLGIVTFLPLNKIKERKKENITNLNGVYGYADSLIQYEPKFNNVFSYVFGSTLVVDSIDVARKIGIGKIRMVTLDGTLLEPSGAIIGGYRRSTGLGFSQKELDEEIKLLEKEGEKQSRLIDLIEDKKIKNESEIIKQRELKFSLESEIVKVESLTQNKLDTYTLDTEKSKLSQSLAKYDGSIKTLNNKLEELEVQIAKLRSKKKDLTTSVESQPNVGKNLDSLEESLNQIRSDINQLKNEQINYDNQISKLFMPEIDRTQKIINDLDKEKNDFEKELNDLGLILKNKKIDLDVLQKEEKKIYGVFRDLINLRHKLSEQIQGKEKLVIQEEAKIKNFQYKLNDLSISMAKVKAEIEAIEVEFKNYHDYKIRRGIIIEDLNLEIRELEKEISKIGSVNLRSLEVYEQLEVEHKDLVEKVTKLKLEKEDVLNLISEIEGKKKGLFVQTLVKIEKSFKEIFFNLSSKGESFLELEDEENPFNGGLDITVKIANNKYMDIKSLSGGEKTMTALAFIFAIQEHEPASFYLLDEVDAALDKHNSQKLANLIAKYASKAQYIVISHNDSIITEAHQIYGVSMQDGISKILSLKI